MSNYDNPSTSSRPDAGASKPSLCLFCGSSSRVDPIYLEAARTFGRLTAEYGSTLVYGGGRVGLMGLAADAAIQAGGRVVGVIPDFLQALEVGHSELDELVVTDSMHARKQVMYERADAFIALPGGFGTLDEMMEVLTWTQLKLSVKPVVLVDIASYWRPLLALLDHTVAQGFSRQENRDALSVVDRVEDVFETIARWEPVSGDVRSKWI